MLSTARNANIAPAGRSRFGSRSDRRYKASAKLHSPTTLIACPAVHEALRGAPLSTGLGDLSTSATGAARRTFVRFEFPAAAKPLLAGAFRRPSYAVLTGASTQRLPRRLSPWALLARFGGRATRGSFVSVEGCPAPKDVVLAGYLGSDEIVRPGVVPLPLALDRPLEVIGIGPVLRKEFRLLK